MAVAAGHAGDFVATTTRSQRLGARVVPHLLLLASCILRERGYQFFAGSGVTRNDCSLPIGVTVSPVNLPRVAV